MNLENLQPIDKSTAESPEYQHLKRAIDGDARNTEGALISAQEEIEKIKDPVTTTKAEDLLNKMQEIRDELKKIDEENLLIIDGESEEDKNRCSELSQKHYDLKQEMSSVLKQIVEMV